MTSSAPTIIDLHAGQSPQTTRAERKGSTALLAPYRDGILLLGKSAGKRPEH